ncbi:MAG: ATP-dependent Clp protease adaptor ClpS [Lentisphaeria bacterium]|nr:ATP-dependent Clp protease adaptor ClpS [Lentisphaeria bacterium]
MSESTDNHNQSNLDTMELNRTKLPPKYKVLLHNDDYTPMGFVVEVLIQVFRRSEIEAYEIMMNVHQRGIGVAGIYTKEIAETKANQVMGVAELEEHPLKCTIEPE